jgi:4-diphosphocytidyl-2-C-methyl-D-erythritol kinase
MVVFPNCKINLGLNITRKRTDGYHDLETIFYPVQLRDALELIQSKEQTFTITGLPVQGSVDDNLCSKAYNLLKKDFPHLPTVSIHLHKAIPMGAGLGGGSADGAFTLLLINKKFNLALDQKQLINYALELGSDCPFFIINKPSFATGRGENMTPVNLDLSTYKIVLVNPGIHVSTKEAFSQLTPAMPQKSIQQIIAQPISTWKDELVNDFEKPIFSLYPAIEQIKNQLYQAGSMYAAMTGTGSTVFGIFDVTAEPNLTFPTTYLNITIPAL